jgi:hypothetical protein
MVPSDAFIVSAFPAVPRASSDWSLEPLFVGDIFLAIGVGVGEGASLGVVGR